jgi:hypothetical protein
MKWPESASSVAHYTCSAETKISLDENVPLGCTELAETSVAYEHSARDQQNLGG